MLIMLIVMVGDGIYMQTQLLYQYSSSRFLSLTQQ